MMFDESITIRGIKLTVPEMVQVHRFYQIASKEEYIFENYNVSAEDAKRIASIVYEKQEEEDSNESLYIIEAAKELGISL